VGSKKQEFEIMKTGSVKSVLYAMITKNFLFLTKIIMSSSRNLPAFRISLYQEEGSYGMTEGNKLFVPSPGLRDELSGLKIFKCIAVILPVLLVISAIYGCSRSASSVKMNYGENVTAPPLKSRLLPEYRLGFGDEIEVKFFNNAQFNELITVRPDGRITLEKIGDIYVTGMTPSQLDSLVTVTYADIIRDPEVTVFVRKFGSYQTYILGEVGKPGGYSVERNMTLVQALTVAGGVKYSGALSSIIILRGGEGEQVHALRIDISGYLSGKQLEIYVPDKEIELTMDEFYIKPLDLIYVPKTPIADVVAFLEQVYAGLLPPIDVYLRALLWTRY
jgi:protein involved in polysaccharide export with SLBB domain